ncbi:MAG: carbohydrate kinase family protein [Halanaeroarchaeum sp.]
MVRVVVAGHVNWDVTLRLESLPAPDGEARITSQRRSGGGSAANVATALVGIGVESALIGSVGDDEPGFLARRELERDGVAIDGLLTVRNRETTVKYLLVDDDGQVMVLGNDGANEAFGPGAIDPAAVRRADHLHLTSQRPASAAFLREVAGEAAVPVSFDPGRRLAERDYGALLDDVDVLFVNDREAEVAMAGRDPARVVAGTDRVIVVKHGAAGATVYVDGAVYHHDGFAVTPVDTTGAGDAFAAGFLAVATGGWDGGSSVPLADADFERAVAVANACGAMAVREEGSRTTSSREAVRAFLAERRSSA